MSRYSGFRQTGPTKATILESATKGWFDIASPYNEEYIENLKTLIVPAMRRWNKDSKLWSIHSSALADVVELLKVYFDDVVSSVGQQKAIAPSADIFGELFKTLKGLPNSNMDKIFLQLSNAVHPDKGGSDYLMKSLNKAYSENKIK